MKLSLVIPAHNEDECIESTVIALNRALTREEVPHEILVVNDNSQDETESILIRLQREVETLRYINNSAPHGFGLAVRQGLKNFDGDVVAIVMADGSDLPEDVIRFYEVIQQGYDCVFGSRFMAGARVVDYPGFKLTLNRAVNFGIRVLFGIKYNDVTNAFKMYRASVIPGLEPFLSHHFNLTVELPLKAIIRGYSYAIVANSWFNRRKGESKLKLREMGSRYLFIILYCFIERWLSRGDYLARNGNIARRMPESGGGARL